MKKVFLILAAAGLLGACASAAKPQVMVNGAPSSYTQELAKADKSCQTDADCVAVKKGCCMCQGYESVNKAAAQKLQQQWEKECAMAACTLQMCYVEIDPVCQNNVCTGTPKPMDSYIAK